MGDKIIENKIYTFSTQKMDKKIIENKMYTHVEKQEDATSAAYAFFAP